MAGGGAAMSGLTAEHEAEIREAAARKGVAMTGGATRKRVVVPSWEQVDALLVELDRTRGLLAEAEERIDHLRVGADAWREYATRLRVALNDIAGGADSLASEAGNLAREVLALPAPEAPR